MVINKKTLKNFVTILDLLNASKTVHSVVKSNFITTVLKNYVLLVEIQIAIIADPDEQGAFILAAVCHHATMSTIKEIPVSRHAMT